MHRTAELRLLFPRRLAGALSALGVLLGARVACAQTPTVVPTETPPADVPTTPTPTPAAEPAPEVAPTPTPTPSTGGLRPLPVQGRPIGRRGALRDPRLRIAWNPAWAHFGPGEYVVAGVGAVAAIVGAILPPTPGRWSGGVLFDDAARNALRLHDPNARGTASDISDVMLSFALAYPFIVDAMAVTWWHRDSGELAIQTVLIDAEALAITGGLQALTAGLASRQRPYGDTCGSTQLPTATTECTYNTHYRSFFSGHSSEAFTSAALLCVNHLSLGLYGGGGAEVATCATGFVFAGATGLLRVVSDNHYLSDVLVGALVGTAVGVAVPLLHWRGVRPLPPDNDPTARRSRPTLTASVVPTGTGAALVGSF